MTFHILLQDIEIRKAAKFLRQLNMIDSILPSPQKCLKFVTLPYLYRAIGCRIVHTSLENRFVTIISHIL